MNVPPNSFRLGPDANGHFGAFGGRYVAETLMPLLLKLEAAYNEAKDDPKFHAELNGLLKHYVGRPSPLYLAQRLTDAGTDFVIPPTVRFVGEPGEQATMFLLDPAGNALEFKALADAANLFAR